MVRRYYDQQGMAPTKKKRSTKHRGNAVGMVESRGRTGRKPAPGERKLTAKEEARQRALRWCVVARHRVAGVYGPGPDPAKTFSGDP